jgi:hypothetical protein
MAVMSRVRQFDHVGITVADLESATVWSAVSVSTRTAGGRPPCAGRGGIVASLAERMV